MAVGKSLVKGVVEAAEDDDTDSNEEVGERVTIRSLEEKVAVGGKNFSELPGSLLG